MISTAVERNAKGEEILRLKSNKSDDRCMQIHEMCSAACIRKNPQHSFIVGANGFCCTSYSYASTGWLSLELQPGLHEAVHVSRYCFALCRPVQVCVKVKLIQFASHRVKSKSGGFNARKPLHPAWQGRLVTQMQPAHCLLTKVYLLKICLSRAILAGNAEPYTLRIVSCLTCSCCLGCYSTTTDVMVSSQAQQALILPQCKRTIL